MNEMTVMEMQDSVSDQTKEEGSIAKGSHNHQIELKEEVPACIKEIEIDEINRKSLTFDFRLLKYIKVLITKP